MMGYIPMTHGDGGGEVEESHTEQKIEEFTDSQVDHRSRMERPGTMPSVDQSPFRIWPPHFLARQT